MDDKNKFNPLSHEEKLWHITCTRKILNGKIHEFESIGLTTEEQEEVQQKFGDYSDDQLIKLHEFYMERFMEGPETGVQCINY